MLIVCFFVCSSALLQAQKVPTNFITTEQLKEYLDAFYPIQLADSNGLVKIPPRIPLRDAEIAIHRLFKEGKEMDLEDPYVKQLIAARPENFWYQDALKDFPESDQHLQVFSGTNGIVGSYYVVTLTKKGVIRKVGKHDYGM